MGRTVHDASLGSPAARAKLQAQGKPHYRSLEPGLHLGYRRTRGKPGTWLARYYAGAQRYEVEAIVHAVPHGTVPCVADDMSPADGIVVLNYQQAIEKARQRHAERGNRAAGGDAPATVASVLDDYLIWLEAHGKDAKGARERANAHIYPTLGDLKLEDLASDRLHQWHASLAKQPARRHTAAGKPQQHKQHDRSDDEATRQRRTSANRVLTILRAALNRAFRDNKVATDEAWRRVKPFRAVDKARVRYLTVAEAQRFIAACDDEFRPLAQAALTTGCRYGSLIRLRVQDFNADAGTLHVRHSKSGKAWHVVLNEEGRAFFEKVCAGRAGHEIMLRRIDGRPWHRNAQQSRVAQACKRAGIKPAVNFHCLRHTWASLAVMANTPLVVVAKNLGHASTNMVQKHYGHLSPDYIADAIRAGAPTFGFV